MTLRIFSALSLAALLAACVNGSSDDPDPGTAKAAWQSNRPDKYSYRLERSCFCLREYVGPFLVEAEGSAVTRVRRVEYGTPPDTVEVTGNLSHYSIDSVFQWVESMLAKDNDHESVEYHPIYGFPAQAEFDMIEQAVDDEISMRITEFRKN